MSSHSVRRRSRSAGVSPAGAAASRRRMGSLRKCRVTSDDRGFAGSAARTLRCAQGRLRRASRRDASAPLRAQSGHATERILPVSMHFDFSRACRSGAEEGAAVRCPSSCRRPFILLRSSIAMSTSSMTYRSSSCRSAAASRVGRGGVGLRALLACGERVPSASAASCCRSCRSPPARSWHACRCAMDAAAAACPACRMDTAGIADAIEPPAVSLPSGAGFVGSVKFVVVSTFVFVIGGVRFAGRVDGRRHAARGAFLHGLILLLISLHLAGSAASENQESERCEAWRFSASFDRFQLRLWCRSCPVGRRKDAHQLTNRTGVVLFRARRELPMLKISKLTDYGLLAAVYLARHSGEVASAREIAEFYHLPVPMITKVLKTLHQSELDRFAARRRRRLLVRRRCRGGHARAAHRGARRAVGPRRMRDAPTTRATRLRDPRGLPVAALHVRHQPCGQRSVRAGHARRPHPRRDAGCARRSTSKRLRRVGVNCMSTTIEQIASQEYKYGFVTDIEVRSGAARPERRHRPPHLAKKNEPEWMLEWRLKAYRHWLTMKEPTWANVHYPPIDYQAIVYYSAPKQKKKLNSLDEVDPELLATFEKLGISLERAEAARRRRRRCGVRQRLGRHDVQGPSSRRSASSSARSPKRCRIIPSSCSKYLGTRRSVHRQLLRHAELRGLHRRLVLLHPEGRALPDGAVDLLPHQRREHRPVRAHADHRRRRRVRQLPRRLHGADARREPAARRGRRAGRARRRARSSTRRCRTGIPATRKARAASTTSSPSAASAVARTRRSRGRRSRPARRSPGSIRAASCRATTRSASSTRSR